jgi:cation transport regulator ChaB
MSSDIQVSTPDPGLNEVLHQLVMSIQAILADNFIAAYLHGSFALGDWDVFSDVDFLIVVGDEIAEPDLKALQSMHSRIYDLDSNWAKHLEGSYFPRELLRRADPVRSPLLYLDNASRELIRSDHDNTRIVRWVTREHGIVLAGPDTHQLIDPVTANELREEVRTTMRDWAQQIFANQEKLNSRWYQPFAVLSYCRMLYTLKTGTVGSKLAGARWALNTLSSRWADLIKRACEERPNPSLKVREKADPDDFTRTLEFIEYALAVSSTTQMP